MTGELDHSHLEAVADAEERQAGLTGVLNCGNLAFDAALAETGCDNETVSMTEPSGHIEARLFEIVNPYLDDEGAQMAFAKAEESARRRGLNHRYLYLPSTAGPEAVAEFWRTLRPNEVVAVEGDEDLLSGIPEARVMRRIEDGVSVVHLLIRPTDATPSTAGDAMA